QRVPDNLIRDGLVPLAADDVEQGLRADHLRERGDHDGVAELGANSLDLLDDLVEAFLMADFGQLAPGGGHDAAGDLVAGERRVEPAGCADGQSLGPGEVGY